MCKNFTIKNGTVVSIEIDECDYTSVVKNSAGQEVGKLEFDVIEEDCGSYLKLVWAYLDELDDKYKRQGIGREILKRVAEMSGLAIHAAENDGHVQNDGSHLTGDAPTFINKMRMEGLIVASPSDYFEEY